MPNPGFIRGGESPRGKLAGVLGDALGQGLGEFTGQYLAEKALQEAKEKPEYKEGTLSERLGLLNQATSRYGQRGAKMFQNESAIQQQQENEFISSLIPKLENDEDLTPEEEKRLPQNVRFQYQQMKNQKKEKQAEKDVKEKQRVQDIKTIGKERGISEKDIFSHINEGGSVEGAKAAWEKESQDYNVSKDLGPALIKNVNETINKANEYAPITNSLNEMKKLAKGFEGKNAIASINPFGQPWKDSANFEALSDTVLEPVFELYNPRGTLAQSKVSLLRSRLKPNWYDPQTVIDAKISALQSLIDHKTKQADKYRKLIVEYKGNPPIEKLLEAQEEDDKAINAINLEKIEGDNAEQKSNSQPRADGKVKVRSKGGEGTGWVTPYEGMESKYDLL